MPVSDSYNEKELFWLIAQGDEAAFKTFFRQYVYQLKPLVYGISGSDSVVEDVIQETLIRIWLNRDKLAAIEEPKAWINKIAANVCYTHHRKQQRLETIAARTHEVQPVTHEESLEAIDLNALKQTIQKGIALLSPQRQKVFTLSRINGMSVPQIAAQLQLSTNTVRNTLNSAMESIREYLLQQGYSPIMIWILLNIF